MQQQSCLLFFLVYFVHSLRRIFFAFVFRFISEILFFAFIGCKWYFQIFTIHVLLQCIIFISFHFTLSTVSSICVVLFFIVLFCCIRFEDNSRRTHTNTHSVFATYRFHKNNTIMTKHKLVKCVQVLPSFPFSHSSFVRTFPGWNVFRFFFFQSRISS